MAEAEGPSSSPMPMEWRLALAVLATWRLTHLLVEEDGPADLVARARAWLGDSLPGRAMDCFYCLSLWLAAPLALVVARDIRTWLLLWPAVSGAACLLERATRHPCPDAASTDGSRGGERHELLRREAARVAGDGVSLPAGTAGDTARPPGPHESRLSG